RTFKFNIIFCFTPFWGSGDKMKNYRKATLRFFIGQPQQRNFRSKYDRRPRLTPFISSVI
ncbi:MAG: hypothetical protein ACI9OS_002095, partial [Ulvibacter sp.]